MNYVETPLVLECAGEMLLAIVSRPQSVDEREIGVLIVAGGPQYRIGSHRQFVLLARQLAENGYPTMRFDRRGMGDGSGSARSFEHAGPDIATALVAMRKTCPGVRTIALWGLCDGASASLLYWHQTSDPAICGFALVNPWVRTAVTLSRARLKYYYLRRLGQADFWRKLLSGNLSGGRAAAELAQNVAASVRTRSIAVEGAGWQREMTQALRQFPGPMLLLLSGQDHTAREFTEWLQTTPELRSFDKRAQLTRSVIAEADHTFSTAAWRLEVEHATLAWLDSIGEGA